MAVIRDSVDERLRYGVGAAGGERHAGVVLFTKIPVGAKVKAYIDAPTELTTNLRATLAPGAIDPTLPAQGYKFEMAQEPSQTAGGVAFRGRQRTLVTSGNGVLVQRQEEPAWAAIATPGAQTGSIKQKGKIEHEFQMPGGQAGDANLKDEDRYLLRLRWTGTAVAAEAQANSTGALQKYTGQVGPGGAKKDRVAPGSFVVNFLKATVATKARDDGRGRIVGNGINGTIDYLTGKFEFTFYAGAADAAGAVTIDYEHSCAYLPIDVSLEWDALQAQ